MTWLSHAHDASAIVARLQELAVTDLEKVNTLLGLANIQKVLALWRDNKNNPREEFWQQLFRDNTWLISQLFATPMIILQGKGYVGGKGIDDSGGQIADFLYKNSLTSTVAMIEIKTPKTPLTMHSPYRDTIYPVTREITGAVLQIVSQKEHFFKDFHSLSNNSAEKFIACNPRCILIAGSLETISANTDQLHSFELYRNSIEGVELITFDEFFQKAEVLVKLLEGQRCKWDRSVSQFCDSCMS